MKSAKTLFVCCGLETFWSTLESWQKCYTIGKKNWTEKRINWTRSDNLFACSTEKQFWPSVQHWKKTRGDLSRGVFRNISKHTIFCLCCLCLHFACPIKTIKGGFSFQRTLVDGCLPSYVPYILPYLKHTQVLELCNLIPTRMRHQTEAVVRTCPTITILHALKS